MVLFLRNSEHGRYGELLVDYRKSYANKDCRYPENVSDTIDVMRQHPDKKRPKSPRNDENKNGDKDKNSDESASSFAQKRKQEEEGEIACYFCGDKDCHLPHCPEREILPAHFWHNPNMPIKRNLVTLKQCRGRV